MLKNLITTHQSILSDLVPSCEEQLTQTLNYRDNSVDLLKHIVKKLDKRLIKNKNYFHEYLWSIGVDLNTQAMGRAKSDFYDMKKNEDDDIIYFFEKVIQHREKYLKGKLDQGELPDVFFEGFELNPKIKIMESTPPPIVDDYFFLILDNYAIKGWIEWNNLNEIAKLNVTYRFRLALRKYINNILKSTKNYDHLENYNLKKKLIMTQISFLNESDRDFIIERLNQTTTIIQKENTYKNKHSKDKMLIRKQRREVSAFAKRKEKEQQKENKSSKNDLVI